jgi:secreted trypsin-like serine protease
VKTGSISIALVLASTLTAGCSSNAGDVGASSSNIVGGQTDTGDAAVVAIAIEGTGLAMCTGTLIAPKIVLTAGHCLIPAIWVREGTNVRGLGWTGAHKITDAVKHPNYSGEGKHYDVALLQLEDDLQNVSPLPLSDTPLTDSDVGTVVRHIGFGITGDDFHYLEKIATGGLKRDASYPITQIDDFFVWSGAPGEQTCIADSGGPTLLNVNGLERIIGTVSAGPDCTQAGFDTRVDRADILSWIDGQLATWGTQRPDSPTP